MQNIKCSIFNENNQLFLRLILSRHENYCKHVKLIKFLQNSKTLQCIFHFLLFLPCLVFSLFLCHRIIQDLMFLLHLVVAFSCVGLCSFMIFLPRGDFNISSLTSTLFHSNAELPSSSLSNPISIYGCFFRCNELFSSFHTCRLVSHLPLSIHGKCTLPFHAQVPFSHF